jgi:hypothetical protein
MNRDLATGVEGTPTSSIGSTVRNPESRSGQAVETQSHRPLGRLTVRHADGGLDRDAERSECPDVMVGISCHVRDSVRRQTFSGSPVT